MLLTNLQIFSSVKRISKGYFWFFGNGIFTGIVFLAI